jgi:hypothetical protein
MDIKPVDYDMAGDKPDFRGKNSREQWKFD